MKNLYDIYEDGIGAIASTPANTVGMGNPMLPTTEEPGTEPLTGVAGKCKCKKKKKQVKEGILDDIEISIDKGDKAMEFINWYIDQTSKEMTSFKKYVTEEFISKLYGMVTVDNDTVIIDMSNAKRSNLEFDLIVIYDTPIPSFIKTLKIYNQSKHSFDIQSYFTDISNCNIEVYCDNGKMYGSLTASFKTKDNDTIKFGNVTCDSLMVVGRKATSLVLGQNSCILELDTHSMYNLTDIYDKHALHNLQKIKATKKYIKHQLCQAGILPWGIDLNIVN
jgi:hypothetical protein